MKSIGAFILPVFILSILVYGIYRKVDIFDAFLDGAADGLKITIKILPALCGLLCAVSMLRASSALSFITSMLSTILSPLGVPSEILPLALLRPISGSGSLAMLTDILKTYGADSAIGKTASVIMGSTETTFYAISVYFGSVGIKDTRYTLPSALLSDFTGLIIGVFITKLLLL